MTVRESPILLPTPPGELPAFVPIAFESASPIIHRRVSSDLLETPIDSVLADSIAINLIEPFPQTHLLAGVALDRLSEFAGAVARLVDARPGKRVVCAFDSNWPKAWRSRIDAVLPRGCERVSVRWRYPVGFASILAIELRVACVIDPFDLLPALHAAVVVRGGSTDYFASDLPIDADLLLDAVGFDSTSHEAFDGDPVCDRRIEPGEHRVAHWLFVRKRLAAARPIECTSCGWCAELCPSRCLPVRLVDAIGENDSSAMKRFGLDACVGCGLCDAVCPSHLPLVSRIRAQQEERQ